MMKILFFKRFEPQKSWKRDNLNWQQNFNLHGIHTVLNWCGQITNLRILSKEFHKCFSPYLNIGADIFHELQLYRIKFTSL